MVCLFGMDFVVSLQLDKLCFFAQCAICLLLLLMHLLEGLRSIYTLCADETSVCCLELSFAIAGSCLFLAIIFCLV